MCLRLQDTIEALMRMPDVAKSLRDILRKAKDASRLLSRLQVGSINTTCTVGRAADAEILSNEPALLWSLLPATCRQCCKALMQAGRMPEINT